MSDSQQFVIHALKPATLTRFFKRSPRLGPNLENLRAEGVTSRNRGYGVLWSPLRHFMPGSWGLPHITPFFARLRVYKIASLRWD